MHYDQKDKNKPQKVQMLCRIAQKNQTMSDFQILHSFRKLRLFTLNLLKAFFSKMGLKDCQFDLNFCNIQKRTKWILCDSVSDTELQNQKWATLMLCNA